MDSGRLKRTGRLMEIKTIEKPSSGLTDLIPDYWPANRGGRLIGGRLIGVRLSIDKLK